jgi:hypothetical protein
VSGEDDGYERKDNKGMAAAHTPPMRTRGGPLGIAISLPARAAAQATAWQGLTLLNEERALRIST